MAGLRVPLSVRLVTRRDGGIVLADRDITAQLRDLDFDAGVPGGFRSAKLSLHRPLSVRHDDIAYYGEVSIHDRATETCWNGRLEDPGRSAGPDGQIWQLTAIGPAGHTRDRSVPLIYADTAHSALGTAVGSGRAYDVGTRESANSTDGALSISARQGNTVTNASLGAAVYDLLYNGGLGQVLARVSIDWDAGFSTANTQVELRTAQDLGATSTLISVNVSTAGGTLTASLGGGTAIPTGHNRFLLTLRRGGATAVVADDLYFAEFFNFRILGGRYLADGTQKTSGYSADTVLAGEVVADLLGRLLPEFDGANAVVAAGTYGIDRLAYADPVTPEKVLADLAQLESNLFWAAWERNPATGLYRFEYTAWPTTVRFEADVTTDVFDSPASGEELWNRCRVRYRTAGGQIATRVRTQTVAELDNAGIIRESTRDLGDEVGSPDNADRAGDEFLAQHQYVPNRGQVTIARPIFDARLGRLVMPWELPRRAPGSLIRIRGVVPNINALNASARDGVTVFRVVSAHFNASSCSARLELDSPQLTLPRVIAPLIRQSEQRRR